MRRNLTLDEILKELNDADIYISEAGLSESETWMKIRTAPELWSQNQYSFKDTFWVVAVMGSNCLYFNFVEGGWGWGSFASQGHIETYHWEQEELHEAFLWRYRELKIDS